MALASGAGAVGKLAAPGAAEAVEIAPEAPNQRRNMAFKLRHDAAIGEKQRGSISHPTNSDEELYPFIGNFTKTLPHNSIGEVDPSAYQALLSALESGDFAEMESVPKGGTRTFLNPLGGLTFTMEGPDSPAVSVAAPPSIASPEWAAQLAELYWMALLRDVPFSQYDSHPLALAARDDLEAFSGYTGPATGGQIGANELFRVAYPGVTDGPMVSQFLYAPFRYDGIPIDPKISTAAPGQDFLTTFPAWLSSINGGPPAGPDPRDPVLRYPRNARDLGRTAGQDTINSQYFKAMLVILGAFGFGGQPVDAANPFVGSIRQGGFATFGIAHLTELIGKAHKSERHTWYQKWNVHRFIRPDGGGARVHVHKSGLADYPIHPDLLVNSVVLDEIFEFNRQINPDNVGTYLLPQMFNGGSPTHPSFPAGHAITAGACVTILKAWYDETALFPDPVQPTDDGLTLVPYVAGVDGPPLTLGGELNKLCHNLSLGRDMSGVHWRADDVEGNVQGEEVAIRILNEEVAIYPEPFGGFTLTRFDGSTVVIDGSL